MIEGCSDGRRGSGSWSRTSSDSVGSGVTCSAFRRPAQRARGELIARRVEPSAEIVEGDDSSWAYFGDAEGNVFDITQRPSGS